MPNPSTISSLTVAPVAESSELAMNAIASWSGLITKRQRLARTPETVAQLADGTRPCVG
jgi:hypothetical protein